MAALTMPSLVANYKKQQTINALKREYSVLSQMVARSQVDNGDIAGWDWSLGTKDFVDTYLLPYVNVIKNCGMTGLDCWLPDNIVYALNGAVSERVAETIRYKIVLNNGTYVSFNKQDNKHIHLVIDVNGPKKPNTFGIDSFNLVLAKEAFVEGTMHNIAHSGLFFLGQGNMTLEQLKNNTASGCNKTADGGYCGALYYQNSWQIPDDLDIGF